ncbi:MAG TPA: DUF5947 family protein [Acidobacteriaceae bacterium]|jgi:hypothetical protein|nr:DUF5947 family protein [Acidobacteriaceae bacterium]
MTEPRNQSLAAPSPADPLAGLRRFTRAQAPVIERCELCGLALGPEHPHLLERQSRRIACACTACALLFYGPGSGRYLRIPEHILHLTDFSFTDMEWEEMALPIGLAFFVSDPEGRPIALYPGPAGVVESLIPIPAWSGRVAAHPALSSLQPEVEALLVNRIGTEHSYFLVPIDECFRLAGIIRRHWRGLSGGPEVWGAVAVFFAELDQKASAKQWVRRA